MEKTLGQRVKEQRDKLGWSQKALGKKLKATQAAISEIERGVSKSSKLLVPMANLFGMDVNELMTGVKPVDDGSKAIREANALLEGDSAYVKPYNPKAVYGNDVSADDIAVSAPYPLSISAFKEAGFPPFEFLAALRSHGSGMSPTIEDGQILIMNTLDTEPESSKIYLVCIDKRLFLKRFVYTPAGWLLRSDNPDKLTYPDFHIRHHDMNNIDIQGRIVWRAGVL